MKAVILLLAAVMVQAQPPDSRPSFEVATVKPCTIDPAGRGGGGGPTPGRFQLGCAPLRDLIHTAYSNFGDGVRFNANGPQILGGPGWIDSTFYEINAKAEDKAPIGKMAGPMLQAVLEDRFNLKVHHETKELPVFVLTVAKGGIRMQRTKEGSCVSSSDLNDPPPPPVPNQPVLNPCGPRRMRGSGATIIGLGGRGMTVAEIFSGIIGNMVGRSVIGKTDLTGQFDFTLEWTPGGIDAPADATGPSIFTAVEEQLGLKMASCKGPVEVVVIDYVKRPSEN
jgi:uncharacterized protein (TIGR03435 family)